MLAPAAPPWASDTIAWPAGSKSKPNGVAPLDGRLTAGPATPPEATAKVSIVFVAFSVTTSVRPSGEKEIWAGPAPASGRAEPGIGRSRPSGAMRNPAIPAAPPALTAYRVVPRS